VKHGTSGRQSARSTHAGDPVRRPGIACGPAYDRHLLLICIQYPAVTLEGRSFGGQRSCGARHRGPDRDLILRLVKGFDGHFSGNTGIQDILKEKLRERNDQQHRSDPNTRARRPIAGRKIATPSRPHRDLPVYMVATDECNTYEHCLRASVRAELVCAAREREPSGRRSKGPPKVAPLGVVAGSRSLSTAYIVISRPYEAKSRSSGTSRAPRAPARSPRSMSAVRTFGRGHARQSFEYWSNKVYMVVV